NGLGDGFEDAAGGQYGSPGRIHDWPKTHLYGYLRWIGTAPAITGHATTITPIPEEEQFMNLSYEDQVEMRNNLRKLVGWTNTIHSNVAPINTSAGPVSLRQMVADGARAGQAAAANTASIKRGGKDISLRQEVADIKTSALKTAPVIVDIAKAVKADDVDG